MLNFDTIFGGKSSRKTGTRLKWKMSASVSKLHAVSYYVPGQLQGLKIYEDFKMAKLIIINFAILKSS